MFNPSLEGYSGHTREVGKKSWWKSLVANKKDWREKKQKSPDVYLVSACSTSKMEIIG